MIFWTFCSSNKMVDKNWRSWSIIATTPEILFSATQEHYGRTSQQCYAMGLHPITVKLEDIPKEFIPQTTISSLDYWVTL